MLLRRVTRHVKDQNWFAVFLDFSIVVAGVLLAIQVAGWNQLKIDKDQAERLLAELVVDLEDMSEVLQAQQAYYETSAQELDALLTQLEMERDDPPPENEVAAILNNVLQIWIPPEPPSLLTTLLETARLDLIDGPDIRPKLRQLEENATIVRNGTGLLSDRSERAYDRLLPYLTLVRFPEAEGIPDIDTVIGVDIDSLWANPRARADLGMIFGYHANMKGIAELMLNDINAILEAAGETDSPNDASK